MTQIAVKSRSANILVNGENRLVDSRKGQTLIASADRGPKGDSGAGRRYDHDQAIPSDIWVIAHNFGVRPYAVQVVDTTGDDVMGDIQHVDSNTIQISFSAAFAGQAYLGA